VNRTPKKTIPPPQPPEAGNKTHNVSEGERATITTIAKIMVTRVVALYMIPGPSTMRTEFRSLVARDIQFAGAVANVKFRLQQQQPLQQVIAYVEFDVSRNPINFQRA